VAALACAIAYALVLALAAGACAPARNGSGGADSARASSESEPAAGKLVGFEAPEPKPKPDFVLTDFDGRRFDFRRDTAGRLTLLFFGYTHCPDVCPVHMANLAAVLSRMPPDDASRVRVVFVTTDPVRDTRARLKDWLGAFDPSFVGLTGTRAELEAALRATGVAPTVAQPAPGDTSYEVGHAAQVLAYGLDGRLRAEYPFGTRQKDWAHDLPILLARAPGPEVSGAYARILPTRDMGAGYFMLVNRGAAADTLLGVRVDGATHEHLHAMKSVGGLVRMVPLGPAALAPGDTLRLSEGGNHVMFDLAPGSSAARAESLTVTLEFARAGDVRVRMPVVAYTDTAR
jgi:protein SCO1/2